MRIVLPLSRYLLYRFGMNAPSRPNSSIKTHVPAPKASMLTAPLAHDPDEAAKIHIDDSAPHGIRPVSSPTANALPRKRQGLVSSGLIRRRNGTPHILSPMSTTSSPLTVRSMLLTVSGLLVVLIGLRMWGVPFLRRISPELTRPCRFRGKAFAVGLLTGLMPCGALSSMWIFAASSGSWASGAVSMLAFGAGTCVFMLLFGLLGAFIPKRYNKYLLKGSTILIVALGLSLMTKGIRLLA